MKRFRAQKVPHGTLCPRMTGQGGELGVRDDLAAPDGTESIGDCLLERRVGVEVELARPRTRRRRPRG